MSYQKDRDEFVAVIEAELPDRATVGVSVKLARLILRNAATIQHCEELVCSNEATDRDRIPCPAIKSNRDEDCCCDFEGTVSKDGCHTMGRLHRDTPRVQVSILRARQRIEAACQRWGIKPHFSGDPRGSCVKLILPSGRHNSWGGAEHGFCVPTR